MARESLLSLMQITTMDEDLFLLTSDIVDIDNFLIEKLLDVEFSERVEVVEVIKSFLREFFIEATNTNMSDNPPWCELSKKCWVYRPRDKYVLLWIYISTNCPGLTIERYEWVN